MKPKFKIINKKNLYKGFFQMNELSFIHQKYDGTWSNQIKRELFIIIILPLILDENEKIVEDR